MIRRRSWDQRDPTKTPKQAQDGPKTKPKSSPKRSKFDIKIVIDFNLDTKTKGACPSLTLVVWAGIPPRGGAPGTQGRGPRHHGTALLGPQAPMRVF